MSFLAKREYIIYKTVQKVKVHNLLIAKYGKPCYNESISFVFGGVKCNLIPKNIQMIMKKR